MQEAEEQLGYTSNTPVYHNNKFHDVVAIDNDEVLLLMLKEMYSKKEYTATLAPMLRH